MTRYDVSHHNVRNYIAACSQAEFEVFQRNSGGCLIRRCWLLLMPFADANYRSMFKSVIKKGLKATG
jgi:hypothetical protein